VTGAGKTTLLDVLADRVTAGKVSGGVFIDGKLRDESFGRRIGYVQQEDIHMSTATVREAVEFSALLRQSKGTSAEEKLAYVDYVLDLLEITAYADAVVGVPGEGLNVEQRKRLSIAVEMAAKPELLLFLGESYSFGCHTVPQPAATNSGMQMSPPRASTAKPPGPSANSSASSPTMGKPSSAPSTSPHRNCSRCLTASSFSKRAATSCTSAR
jgi:hypothetical protein